MDILNSLNPRQKEAASHIDGALLILAGAGSGKTKTITSRLAYLIDAVGIPAQNTLTLTFTNKAAAEMRSRALNMIKNKNAMPLLCTFHKFGLLFLRLHMGALNRRADFTLYDSDDVSSLLKKIQKEVISSSFDKIQISSLKGAISSYKSAQIPPQEVPQYNLRGELIAKIYAKYEKYLIEQNALDFDDLLLLPLKIMEENPKIAHDTSEFFQYIMVDEYQDTNAVQFKLLGHLASTHNNICVVGDDDQSIYSWRGADIKNILDFTKHFSGAKVVKLEENYRSNAAILEAANKLISQNKNRLGKVLKPTLPKGEAVKLLRAPNARAECEQIAKIIKEKIASGVEINEIAILFRLNAVSRSLEEVFNREKIPFVLVGTVRFYERAEIKDILCYLRLLCNPRDDLALARVINQPKRGIGQSSFAKIAEIAARNSCSIFDLFCEESNKGGFKLKKDSIKDSEFLKLYSKFSEFFALLCDLKESLNEFLENKEIDFLDEFENKVKLSAAYEKEDESAERVGNIREFYGIWREYFESNAGNSLNDFLSDLALQSEQESAENRAKNNNVLGVQCMSVHSSKGLEFKVVFVIALEEGIFPLNRDDDDVDMQEERRLGYVAITRAKNELFLSYADERIYYGRGAGESSRSTPSRFLYESGILQKNNNLNYLDSIESTFANFKSSKNILGGFGGADSIESSGNLEDGFKKGDCVMHKIFGAGRIESISHSGKELRLSINFGGQIRTILSDFVKKV